MKIKAKLLLTSLIPLAVMGILLSVMTFVQIKSSLQEQAQVSLKAVVMSLKDDYSDVEGDNYWVDEDGALWDNDYNITEDSSVMDSIYDETGIITTIFFGNTRVSTSARDESGNRMIGTTCSDAIYNEVVVNGNTYSTEGVVIGGNEYFVYYEPLWNLDEEGNEQDIVGMVFAGYPQESIDVQALSGINGVIVVDIIIGIISIIVVTLVALSLSRNLKEGVSALDKVSKGDLTIEINPKNLKDKDETGDISRSLVELRDNLKNIMTDIKTQSEDVDAAAGTLNDSAESAASTIESVEKAVAEIAEGAGKQAQDTEASSMQVAKIGEMIQKTDDELVTLNTVSDAMEESGENASKTLKELSHISEQAKVAIDEIYEQTNTTNESAKKISEAVQLITDIAEETNLLSLNASIEAARAGEQGRGFAVVAGQIQKLAEQSNESAQHIEEIIQSLMEDSAKAVESMNEAREIMNKQGELVSLSGENFIKVIDGVEKSKANVKKIAANMKELNSAKDEVTEKLAGLAGIAQSNAAAAEETSASTEEVAASTEDISSNALNLKNIADSLKEAVETFKM